jgi:putative SOS response-associated peptidase YedK
METRALFAFIDAPEFPPREHIAPGQPIGVVRMENGQRRFALVRWGFIPGWAKEVPPGKPLINARGETVTEKPSFKHAFRRRRCLVPADGYYEWSGDVPGRKTPYFVTRKAGALFALAGLWEHWMAPDGSEIETAILLTISPNREMAAIHDRMPVVIEAADHETWLSGEADDAARLIRPAPAGSFFPTATQIGRKTEKAAKPKEADQLKLF